MNDSVFIVCNEEKQLKRNLVTVDKIKTRILLRLIIMKLQKDVSQINYVNIDHRIFVICMI